jgi:hypothetical protein
MSKIASLIKRHYTRDSLLTFDQATMDSAGAFLIGELERLDPMMHMPLANVTWHRDIDPRTDVTIGDELSSFSNSTFAAVGGTSPTGKAWIGKVSNGLPGMALDISKTATPLTLWGMELAYTLPELASAMQIGRPIDSQKLEAIRLKLNMDLDQQVYVGDTDLGLAGLCNNSAVTPSNVVTGVGGVTWALKTASEILKDIRDAEVATWAASGYAVAPRQVLVPPSQMALLLQPMTITVGSNTVSPGGSIAEYIARNSLCMQQNGVPLEINAVKWLKGAGASATDRFVVYTREYDKVRFPMTTLLNTPVENKGIYKITSYYCRIGAVEMPYGVETVSYRDGI